MASWETWPRDQEDWNGDQAYRGVYDAWWATKRAHETYVHELEDRRSWGSG